MSDYRKAYGEWMESSLFDEETRREVAALRDEREIEDRFYRELDFGTGGLRGILGAGTNRMNSYTVGKATQGVADLIYADGKAAAMPAAIPAAVPMVVIAYDSRRRSAEFALRAALVLAANGIRACLFDALRPVPVLSFAVRHLKADMGIMITASHNPPSYNGYKIYGSDGAQLPVSGTDRLIEAIRAVGGYGRVRVIGPEEAERRGLLCRVGSEIDDAYIAAIKTQRVHPEVADRIGGEVGIVYTPIHGTGNVPVRRILKETGFTRVWTVPEQEAPDPDFSTVLSPNPEEREALTLALCLAEEKQADLVLGTDPDSDRMGIAFRDRDGTYRQMTGNQAGCLLMAYILSERRATGRMPVRPFVVKTIVSSELGAVIAAENGVELVEVLTGFKFIGEQIRRLQDEGDRHFVYGYEESYGYLSGSHARDKDGVVACMLMAEMTAWYHSRGMTLADALDSLGRQYGYYEDHSVSFQLEGKDGLEKIGRIMQVMRTARPGAFGPFRVRRIRDYKTRECLVVRKDGQFVPDGRIGDHPVSDVLYYEIDDSRDDWACIRPSGTEPKLKIYAGVSAPSREKAAERLEALAGSVLERLRGFLD